MKPCFIFILLFAGTVKVEDVTSGNSNATIQLHNSNFSSNLTVYYRPCSGGSSTTRQFRPPIRVVQLESLEAETMYCYNITYNGSNITGASTCNGTFNTSSSKGKSTYKWSDTSHTFYCLVLTTRSLCMACMSLHLQCSYLSH